MHSIVSNRDLPRGPAARVFPIIRWIANGREHPHCIAIETFGGLTLFPI